MTNFLTRLVERTLGTMPLVQPRIASIYDPGDVESRGEISLSPLEKAATEISDPPVSTNSVDKVLPNNFEIKTTQSHSEIAGDFIDDELVIKPRPNIKYRAGETPTPQEFLETSRTGETPTPQEFLETSRTGKTPTPQEFLETSRAGETPTPQEFLQRSILDQVESSSVMPEPISAMSPKITTKVDIAVGKNEQKAISLSDEIASLPKSNQPEMQQIFSNSPSSINEEMGKLPITNYQSPITQTIKVSIGRIEVRAISAPPASPASRKSIPTPKLSLSEYLRQNGGGG